MGSVSSTPNTTAGFTGSSLFSTALQNVISRAVAIASLPIQQLTNEQSTLNSQLTELNQVSSLFTSLQTSVSSLVSASSNNAISATVSDNSVLTATATGSALPGTYTVQVLDPGSFASALSSNGLTTVTDPTTQNISSGSSFTLTVNSTTYTLNPSGTNLNALAASINQSGAPVQATVINIGTPSQADYRLALQSTSVGSNTIQVSVGTKNLLTSLAGGGNASYTVNGQPPGGISSNSRTVTIAPGLTANLEQTGTTTITVGASTSDINNALQSFVTAYNAVVDELGKNRGQNGGALTGDSVILSANQALRQIANYSSGTSGITSLESIGIGFDKSGHLQFDPTQINSFSQSQLQQLTSFLGTATSGGFLEVASSTLTGLLDPSTGLLTQAANSTNDQITQTAQQISTDQDQVNALQTSLSAQMAAADALISSLEQTNNFVTGLFNQINANNFAGH
jgi:flagellar hook-associated protein 2